MPARVPHFTIRGRLPAGPELLISIDETASPVAPGAFRECVLDAIATWNSTGLVQIAEASGPALEVVELSWRSGRHGACPSFGHDTSVAHAGPVAHGSFIHFDQDREWTAGAGDEEGLPLRQVVLHELGHILGLDHCNDESAVMHANYDASRARPATSDLAGLASLYGELEPGEGDLLATTDGVERAWLWRVAPTEFTGFAAWDVDRDSRADILVWRTDPAGHGNLTVYHFDEEGRLDRSWGPMIGCVEPGALIQFDETSDGRGLLLSVLPTGHYNARVFGDALVPVPAEPGARLKTRLGFVDSDGDGVIDHYPGASPERPEPVFGMQAQGDLTGDGARETLRRRSTDP